MTLSGLDIVFLILIAFASLRTGLRGFVKELLTVAALVLGIAGAVLFYGVAAEALGPTVGLEGTWAQVVSFLAIFLLVYVVLKLFERALNGIIDRIHLESLDHALGFFLGVVEGVLLVFVILIVLQWQNVVDVANAISESTIATLLLPFIPYARRLMSVAV